MPYVPIQIIKPNAVKHLTTDLRLLLLCLPGRFKCLTSPFSTLLVVGHRLLASRILPPTFNPASFLLVFFLIFFLTFFLIITVLNSDSPLRVRPIHLFCPDFIVRMYKRSFFSNRFQTPSFERLII